ncbi:hypothetical protein SCA6_001313 [Theobroma cacao]
MFYSEEYSGEECYGRIEKDILVASAKVEGSPQLFGSDYGRRVTGNRSGNAIEMKMEDFYSVPVNDGKSK